MNVVVTGWVAPFPLAGFLWHPLGFALGFRDLGHDVWYIEDSGDAPWGYDPTDDIEDSSCRAGIAFMRDELAAVGLGDRWAFRHVPTDSWAGLDRDTALDVIADADVLVNVSLTLTMRPEYLRIPHRLAIDTDPVFTQVRIARGDAALAPVPELHTRLFTFGRPPLPAQRAADEWVPTRQAVHAASWPVAAPPPDGASFSTVTTWKAYPPVAWDGVEYGAKDRAMLPFLDLPSQVVAPLSVAMGAGSEQAAGTRLLAEHGWLLDNPIDATRSSAAYRRFIEASAGELGFAKHGYVEARSGWFSERTCCYLASGRPAIVQDTGWTDWLPSGDGLIAFSTPAEAATAIETVTEDHARHAKAARALVEQHFEASTVCTALLDAL